MGYKSPNKLSIFVGGASFSPVDATTYYFSAFPASTPSTTILGHQIAVPQNGIIASAIITIFSGTAAGTNEAWEIYVRVNDTTDYLIASVSAAASNRFWRNNSLSIPITTSDFFCIKMICPTWATNPDGCRVMGTIGVNIE